MLIATLIGLWLLFNICIFVHEMGHAIVAILVGAGIRQIYLGFPTLFTLNFFGIPVSIGLLPLIGLAEIKNMDMGWFQKMVIAVAGPLASFGFALVAYAGLDGMIPYMASHQFFIEPIVRAFIENSDFPLPNSGPITEGLRNIIIVTGNVNLGLAVLNMLPVPFLDGGRFLFAILEGIFGEWVASVHMMLIPISVWVFYGWLIFR